jgi:hypothetical protein
MDLKYGWKQLIRNSLMGCKSIVSKNMAYTIKR